MNSTPTPSATPNANLAEIMAAEQQAREQWEATTVAGSNGWTIADFRRVTDRIFDPQNWKAPWAAAVHHSAVGLVLEAVTFFHGAKPEVVGVQPITGLVLMAGDGYAAD